MATKSITDTRNFAQQKSYSVSAAVVTKDDFDGTNTMTVFNLPEKSMLIKVNVLTEEAGNTGLTLKIDVGSATVISAADVDTKGDIANSSTQLGTGTGKVVNVTPSATVTAGSIAIICEYIEYTLGTGNNTNY